MSVRGGKTFSVGLTLASDREEDQTARFANVRCHQVLDEVDIGGVSTLADAGNQPFPNTFSSAVKREELDGVPGRSQNDRSVNSGPLISRETQFLENVSSR